MPLRNSWKLIPGVNSETQMQKYQVLDSLGYVLLSHKEKQPTSFLIFMKWMETTCCSIGYCLMSWFQTECFILKYQFVWSHLLDKGCLWLCCEVVELNIITLDSCLSLSRSLLVMKVHDEWAVTCRKFATIVFCVYWYVLLKRWFSLSGL